MVHTSPALDNFFTTTFRKDSFLVSRLAEAHALGGARGTARASRTVRGDMKTQISVKLGASLRKFQFLSQLDEF